MIDLKSSAVSVLLVCLPAVAETHSALVEKNQAQLEKFFAPMFASRCGAEIALDYDAESLAEYLKKNPPVDEAEGLYTQCGAAVEALSNLCRDDGFSDEVKAQLTGVRCRFGPRKVTLEDKILIVSHDANGQGMREWSSRMVPTTLSQGAFNLSQIRFMREEDERFYALTTDAIFEECKHEIDAAVDWDSLRPVMDARIETEKGELISNVCAQPLVHVLRVCTFGKARGFKKRVSSYRCSLSKNAKPSLTVKNSVLTYLAPRSGEPSAPDKMNKLLLAKKLVEAKPKMRDIQNPAALLRTDASAKCRQSCPAQCGGAPNKAKCVSKCRRQCP